MENRNQEWEQKKTEFKVMKMQEFKDTIVQLANDEKKKVE
jgi:hypothetical protein